MKNLPTNTVINKQLSKKQVYEVNKISSKIKNIIDKDISRIIIMNELNADNLNVLKGKEIKSFYILKLKLKTKEYSNQSIMEINKLIPQNIVYILEYEDIKRMVVYKEKLIESDWFKESETIINIKGYNLDEIWENIIIELGNVKINSGNTLTEQIIKDIEVQKINNKIKQLEKRAWNEKQPKIKFKIAKEIKELKNKRSSI